MPEVTEATDGLPFVDVPQGEYYCEPVSWAYESGVTKGADETHFDPDGACTRGNVVTFLWRFEQKPTSAKTVSLTDLAGLNSDFASAIAWAAGEGITTGYSDGTFRPNATCTRAHVVTFLWRDMTKG